MIHPKSILTAGLLGFAAISSCSSWLPAKKTEPKTEAKSLTLIGRVASLPPDRKFVLIQSYGRMNLDAGAILTTRGSDDRTANLKVTGEKMGQFAAADIQSGTVELGDAVYSLHVPKPVPVPAAPTGTTPAAPGETSDRSTPAPPIPSGESAPLPDLPEPMPEPPSGNVQKNN